MKHLMVEKMIFIFMLFSFSSNDGSIRKQGVMIGCVTDRCTVNILYYSVFYSLSRCGAGVTRAEGSWI